MKQDAHYNLNDKHNTVTINLRYRRYDIRGEVSPESPRRCVSGFQMPIGTCWSFATERQQHISPSLKYSESGIAITSLTGGSILFVSKRYAGNTGTKASASTTDHQHQAWVWIPAFSWILGYLVAFGLSLTNCTSNLLVGRVRKKHILHNLLLISKEAAFLLICQHRNLLESQTLAASWLQCAWLGGSNKTPLGAMV